MQNGQQQDVIALLKSIDRRLGILVKLQRINMPAPKLTHTQKQVLNLCDKKHTIEDMVRKLGKKRTTIEPELSKLRTKGLIESTTYKKKLVYGRT